MNVKGAKRFAVWIGGVALSILATACGGSTGSLLAANTIPDRAQTSSARPAPSERLYVSTLDGGSVVVYSTNTLTLMQTITDGAPRPGGVWVDKHGILYAVNVPDQSYQTSLPEYQPGSGAPFRTITDGIVDAGSVAVDSNDNVYVTGIRTQDASIFLEIYPKGQMTPAETLTVPHTGLGAAAGLAFDSTGALLVGESLFGKVKGAVYRLPAGSQTFTNLDLKKAPAEPSRSTDREIFTWEATTPSPFIRQSPAHRHGPLTCSAAFPRLRLTRAANSTWERLGP